MRLDLRHLPDRSYHLQSHCKMMFSVFHMLPRITLCLRPRGGGLKEWAQVSRSSEDITWSSLEPYEGLSSLS